MSQKKRKYQDNYLDFGFTYLIQDGLRISQGVLCIKTFSNSTMKPASLKQRLANAHPSMISKKMFLFLVKTLQSEKTKAGQNWNVLADCLAGRCTCFICHCFTCGKS